MRTGLDRAPPALSPPTNYGRRSLIFHERGPFSSVECSFWDGYTPRCESAHVKHHVLGPYSDPTASTSFGRGYARDSCCGYWTSEVTTGLGCGQLGISAGLDTLLTSLSPTGHSPVPTNRGANLW
jgi:hypothetical protein